MEESGEAYFDKAKGKWVFPGQEEEEEVISAPPTQDEISKLSKSIKEAPVKEEKPLDKLMKPINMLNRKKKQNKGTAKFQAPQNKILGLIQNAQFVSFERILTDADVHLLFGKFKTTD